MKISIFTYNDTDSGGELYPLFENRCLKFYLILRRHIHKILISLKGISLTNPDNQAMTDPDSSQAFLLNRLYVDLKTDLKMATNNHDHFKDTFDNFLYIYNEENAIENFRQDIHEAISTLFPTVIDTLHRWSQYWKS